MTKEEGIPDGFLAGAEHGWRQRWPLGQRFVSGLTPPVLPALSCSTAVAQASCREEAEAMLSTCFYTWIKPLNPENAGTYTIQLHRHCSKPSIGGAPKQPSSTSRLIPQTQQVNCKPKAHNLRALRASSIAKPLRLHGIGLRPQVH